MTDNEKRAHDLALSLYPGVISRAWNKAGTDLDPYETYKKIYDSILERLNHDYESGTQDYQPNFDH